MFKSFVTLGYLLPFLVQPQIEPVQERPELFQFLKAVASEELDKIDHSSEYSPDSDFDETIIQIGSPFSSYGPQKTIKKMSSPKMSSKKTSLCKGITRR